jgi:WD40 repeat protein
MGQVKPNAPSGLRARLILAWQATSRVSARFLRGDFLGKEKYAVFISYRHVEPDRRWAVWLHGALESFVIPKGLRDSPDHRRIGRVFRDEEELAASPHLSADIKAALDRSDWLIVVCSPRTVESKWVSAEVQHFRELQRGDKILALLIEGEPAQSFPQALYEIRRSVTGEALASDEPLAADVRPSPEIKPGTAKRWAKLRLLATILGGRFDDLRQREKERRTRWLAMVAAAAVGFFVVASLGVYAERQKIVAEREAGQKTIEAETNASAAKAARDVATENASRTLASEARGYSARREYGTAIVKALAALPKGTEVAPRQAVPEAIEALRDAVLHMQERVVFRGHTGRVDNAMFTMDGRFVITIGGADYKLMLWDTYTGRLLQTIECLCVLSETSFSNDGQLLMLLDGFYPLMHIYTLNNGNLNHLTDLGTREIGDLKITYAEFNSSSKEVVSGDSGGTVTVWDVSTHQKIRTYNEHSGAVMYVSFTPDDDIISVSADGFRHRYDSKSQVAAENTDTGCKGGIQQPYRRPVIGNSGVAAILIQCRDNTVITGKYSAGHYVSVDEKYAAAAGFTSGGADIAIGDYSGKIKVYSGTDGHKRSELSGHILPISSITATKQSGYFASASRDGTAVVWKEATGERGEKLAILAGHTGELTSISIAPGENSILTGSEDQTARLWSLWPVSQTWKFGVAEPKDTGPVEGRDIAGGGRHIHIVNGPNDAYVQGADFTRIASLGKRRHSITAACLSPGGRYLAIGTDNNEIEIWAVADWTKAVTLTFPEFGHALDTLTMLGTNGEIVDISLSDD